MIWWMWVLVGVTFLVVEMATPGGLFALFFGLSAILVGILTGAGVGGPAALQWALFSVFSVLAVATLRRPLRARLNLTGPGRPVDSLVGTSAVAVDDLPVGTVGKVELRGTSWNARSSGGSALSKGQRCVVEKVDGLTLWVRPE
jgi:inner membrane protein